VEVHVNELTGTMSWRTLGAHAARPAHAPGPAHDRHGGPGDTGPLPSRTAASRLPAEAPFSVRAAALRSAGLDPARAPAKGAAPIPTHPAAVRASLSVDVASLGPEQLRLHMARIGALRSAVAADLAHGTRLPAAAASRLRSTTATPSHAHALTAEHTATPTAIRRAATTRTATTRTASAPRTTTATTTHPPTPAARPTPAPGAPHGR
jgi:hypothetical protein